MHGVHIKNVVCLFLQTLNLHPNKQKYKSEKKTLKIKKIKVSKKTKTWTRFKKTEGLHSVRRSQVPTSMT
jgi:hypothetical protein